MYTSELAFYSHAWELVYAYSVGVNWNCRLSFLDVCEEYSLLIQTFMYCVCILVKCIKNGAYMYMCTANLFWVMGTYSVIVKFNR